MLFDKFREEKAYPYCLILVAKDDTVRVDLHMDSGGSSIEVLEMVSKSVDKAIDVSEYLGTGIEIMPSNSKMRVWFDYEGNDKDSIRTVVEKGEFELGATRTGFSEFFFTGELLSGRYILKTDPVGIKFQKSGDSSEPYVLSASAIKAKWLPKGGRSALPLSIKKAVSHELKYWEISDTKKALAARRTLGRNAGDAQGAGPGGTCYCPKCKTRYPHATGAPCNTIKCPKCGELMTRDVPNTVKFVVKTTDEPEYIIGGIVYEPNVEDLQKDMMTKEEIWKLMKHFMVNGRKLSIEHSGKGIDLPIIECFQPEEATMKGGQEIPAGAFWLSVFAGDHMDVFKAAQEGKINGFSMEGWGIRRDVE